MAGNRFTLWHAVCRKCAETRKRTWCLGVLPPVSRRDLLELRCRDAHDLDGCLRLQRRSPTAALELRSLADDRTGPELTDDLVVHDDLEHSVEHEIDQH